MYVWLDVIINNNPDKLFSQLWIPQGMVDTNCPHSGLATFLSELPQFVIHQLLLLVCREGHFQGQCYYGHFDLSRVLVSFCGHMIVQMSGKNFIQQRMVKLTTSGSFLYYWRS